MSETWTVLRLLTWTTDYLKKHGSESPRLEAEVLLASAKGCERIMLYTAFDEVVSDEVRAKFRDLVKRRAEGTPVAYLVGKKEFYSLSLRVTPDVLDSAAGDGVMSWWRTTRSAIKQSSGVSGVLALPTWHRQRGDCHRHCQACTAMPASRRSTSACRLRNR